MDEMLKTLPDLHKDFKDLNIEATYLKRSQMNTPEKSISHQERIKDAFGPVPLPEGKGDGDPEIEDKRRPNP
ncbi:UNVERIFIED_CONTAM: hypothetical protein Sangu_1739800 [Sesamum angustifolium]|uniref:Uncharacterized protein n=1 Tax=Sesamum angustifolium TaxID=2727405 RepID=A0AAW2M833_9LAMI